MTFFKVVPVVLPDFIDHYVWIDVRLLMYMLGDSPFIA